MAECWNISRPLKLRAVIGANCSDTCEKRKIVLDCLIFLLGILLLCVIWIAIRWQTHLRTFSFKSSPCMISSLARGLHYLYGPIPVDSYIIQNSCWVCWRSLFTLTTASPSIWPL